MSMYRMAKSRYYENVSLRCKSRNTVALYWLNGKERLLRSLKGDARLTVYTFVMKGCRTAPFNPPLEVRFKLEGK